MAFPEPALAVRRDGYKTSTLIHLRGVKVRHILADGGVEEHAAATERLLELLEMSEPNMFLGKEDLVSEAYRVQAERIAYERSDSDVKVG